MIQFPFDSNRKNALFLVVDRCVVGPDSRKRLLEAIEHAASQSNGSLYVDAAGKDLFFNLAFADPTTGKSYPSITPHTFSFNTEQGMCPDCLGLGFQYGIDLLRNRELAALSITGLMRELWQDTSTPEAIRFVQAMLDKYDIDPYESLKKLPPEHLQLFLQGPMEWKGFQWLGLNQVLGKAAKIRSDLRDYLSPLLTQTTCLSCQGSRLNSLARHVKIENCSVADFCKLPINEALAVFGQIKSASFLGRDPPAAPSPAPLFRSHRPRVSFARKKRSNTQRWRNPANPLKRQLGSGLTGCLYVLDEPTIGLHPLDNELLNQALLKLRDMNNTLLLVEHDPLTISIADYILDFGPKAGKEGGKITAKGTLPEILKNPNSLTGAYLSGRKEVPIPKTRRKAKTFFTLKHCQLHNLKNFDINIPIALFSCITGVSGSGKSTLLHDILKPTIEKNIDATPFNKLIVLDQNPLGQTNRSDVSTYVELLSPLRQLFAAIPEAKAKGLQAKHFSFNHRRGMCPSCYGIGTKAIQLQFLPAVKMPCEACQGYRLNPLSLSIYFKGKHMGQILQMTVKEAREFLDAFPKIVKILDTLIAVGLDYLQLGQEIATLSGGEQQRIRLSRELAKRSTGKTLYLFDEPTIGLHSDDIVKLLTIFHELVSRGNTLVLIEHNLDVISNADMIFDLGPGAGNKGGYLVAQGTPEELVKNKHSVTGRFLKEKIVIT